jgi:Zn-dependent alcohol dehydrogenase
MLNTSDASLDLVAEVKRITKDVGSMVTIDTTGNLQLIKKGMDFTGNFGQCIILGIPPKDALLEVHLGSFLSVRVF